MPVPRPTDRAEPLIAVELLRLACAVAVMALHYAVGFWREPGAGPSAMLGGVAWRAPAEAAFGYGWIGVELFFVISGAMIAGALPAGDPAGFLRRRALRLAPAAWLCATLTLVVVAAAGGGGGARLLTGWARSVAFWPFGEQVDGSYWTLGIELAFYLAAAAALARRVPPHRLAWWLAAASGGFWLATCLAPAAMAPLAGMRIVQLLLLPHGCFFALGMAIAHPGDRRMRAAMVLAVPAATVEVIAHAGLAAAGGVAISALVALALFAAGVGVLVAAPRWQASLRSRITPGAARMLGRMTYPLYLIHQDAGAAVAAALIGRGLPVGAALLACAGASLLVAWAIAMHAEPRLRALLARALAVNRRRAPAPDNPRSAFPPAG